MIALTISTIMLAEIASVTLGAIKMINDILSTSTLIVGTRRVREKILFGIVPFSESGLWQSATASNGTTVAVSPGGALNSYNLHPDSASVTLYLTNVTSATSTRLRMIVDNSGFLSLDNVGYVTIGGVLQPGPWLRPDGLVLTTPSEVIDYSRFGTNNLLYLDLDYTVNKVRRAERIYIPAFDKVQPASSPLVLSP